MSQRVLAGAGIKAHEGNGGGGLYGFAVGDQLNVSLNGSGSIDISLMFHINGEKTYQNITVSNTTSITDFPEGTDYYEFNIQSVSAGVSYINMSVIENY